MADEIMKEILKLENELNELLIYNMSLTDLEDIIYLQKKIDEKYSLYLSL